MMPPPLGVTGPATPVGTAVPVGALEEVRAGEQVPTDADLLAGVDCDRAVAPQRVLPRRSRAQVPGIHARRVVAKDVVHLLVVAEFAPHELVREPDCGLLTAVKPEDSVPLQV